MSTPPVIRHYRSWTNSEREKKTIVVDVIGRATLTELIDYLFGLDEAQDLSPDDVTVSGSLRWEVEPTQEELNSLAEQKKASDERHAEWERQMYARLHEKFKGGSR